LRSEPKKFKRTLEFGQFHLPEGSGEDKVESMPGMDGVGIRVFFNGVNDITIREG
jgi:hypothetical protein